MANPRAESTAFEQLTNQLISNGVGFRFQAQGRSMLPAIQDSDMLRVEPLNSKRLKVGDIILFRSAGEFKAHRIVHCTGETLITRGDAGTQSDGEIRPDQVVGLVIAKECTRTGRVVSLRGPGPRTAFLIRTAWRLISTTLRSIIA